jgi:hypothetical protein
MVCKMHAPAELLRRNGNRAAEMETFSCKRSIDSHFVHAISIVVDDNVFRVRTKRNGGRGRRFIVGCARYCVARSASTKPLP